VYAACGGFIGNRCCAGAPRGGRIAVGCAGGRARRERSMLRKKKRRRSKSYPLTDAQVAEIVEVLQRLAKYARKQPQK
jgi:hypothetical protein